MKTIILHELQRQIKSTHFIVLLVTCCILFIVNAVIYVQQYQEDVAVYSEHTQSPYPIPSTITTEIYSESNPLLFISASGRKNLPLGYTVKPTGIIEPLPSNTRNYKFPTIPDLDWIYIIINIFSLYTIILGHSMISGDKETGTLHLMLSNAISRSKVFLGKYFSLLCTVLIPLIAGVTINLIIISIYSPEAIAYVTMGKIVTIVLIAMCYISVFAALSILISTAFHNSSVAVIMLLLIWTFITSIPKISEIIVDKYIDVPSEHQIAQEIGPLINELLTEKINDVRKRVRSGELRTEYEIEQELYGYLDDTQNQFVELQKTYNNAMIKRAEVIQQVSMISPMVLCQSAIEILSDTGFTVEKEFLSDIEDFSNRYDDYIREKIGWLVGPWGFKRIEYNMLVKGNDITVSMPYPKEYNGDKSDFPSFGYKKRNIYESLHLSLMCLGGLITWNAMLLILALFKFNTYDAR